MSDEQKLKLVDALIKEDDNATIGDYLSVVNDVEYIETSVLVDEFKDNLGLLTAVNKTIFTVKNS